MTENEKYFVNLIYCFLNSLQPTDEANDWKELYKLSRSQHMLGITSYSVMQLPKEKQPTGDLGLKWRQLMGLTVSYNEAKTQAQEKVEKILLDNNFDYLFVKGNSVSDLYPVNHIRLSSDIDVIVRENKYDDVVKCIKSFDFKVMADTTTTFEFEIDGYPVEIHRDADVFGNYFDEIFEKCTCEGNKYTFNQYDNLMYILLHLVKHLASSGAGIRMLMDIDVCIRSIDGFDIGYFLGECKKACVEKCAKTLLCLCKYWFGTPVDINDDMLSDSILAAMESVFLRGGAFGYDTFSLGGQYIYKTGAETITTREKINALLKFFFPSPDIIFARYPLIRKFKILLPFGYVIRFFEATFLRGERSINTVKQISKADDKDLLQQQICSELEISIE